MGASIVAENESVDTQIQEAVVILMEEAQNDNKRQEERK